MCTKHSVTKTQQTNQGDYGLLELDLVHVLLFSAFNTLINKKWLITTYPIVVWSKLIFYPFKVSSARIVLSTFIKNEVKYLFLLSLISLSSQNIKKKKKRGKKKRK